MLGFTLIELVIAIAILMILLVFVIVAIDPSKQFTKSFDSRRLSDISRIKMATELYYDENECFPGEDSVQFGSRLQDDSGTVYLNPLPHDPEYSKNPSREYSYITEVSTCPQWSAVFGKLSEPTTAKSSLCPLTQMPGCLPQGYAESGYNYCVVSGTPNCSYLASLVFGSGSVVPPPPTPPNPPPPNPPPVAATPTPTPTASPTPSPTPTPTPTPACVAGQTRCVGNSLQTCILGSYQLSFNCSLLFGAVCDEGQGQCVMPPPFCSKDYICSVGQCNEVRTGRGSYCTSNCNNACQ